MWRLLVLTPAVLMTGCFLVAPRPVAPPSTPVVEDVSYPSGNEVIHGTLMCLPGTPASPAVILVHDDFGPTNWVREQGEALLEDGYVALVVDLYRGDKPANLMDAHILGRGLPDDRALADIRAAVDYLSRRPDVRANSIGIVGFGMGGGYALDAAIADPRLKAVVTCYGRVPTEAATLKGLQAPVLAIFAEQDEGITPQTRDQFQSAMQKAGKRLAGLHVYENCRHGFLDPGAPTPSGTEDDRDTALTQIGYFLEAELPP
jgi:carboxymethylenebutenolidase